MTTGGDAPPRAGDSPEAAAGVSPSEQARKALCVRSPFDGEEAVGRDPWLPARVARWAAVGDVRKKHKKGQPTQQQQTEPAAALEKQPKVPAGSKGFWDQMEPYFREFTADDFEELLTKHQFGSGQIDPCFLIPVVGGAKELEENLDPPPASVADDSSDMILNLGTHNELESNGVQDTQESSKFIEGNVELVCKTGSNQEKCDHDMQEVIVQQEEHPVEIILDQSKTGSTAFPECREDSVTSLSWLLGTRGRFVLTSERPNKKRKLLGADAGLEQLMLLPSLEGEAGPFCDVCCLRESGATSNRMLQCKNCEIYVHQKCYGVHVVPDRSWFCVWCLRNIEIPRRLTRSDACRSTSAPCVLCPKEKGALKPVKRDPGSSAEGGNQEFVHLFCSLWKPDFLVEDTKSMETVTNIIDTQENQIKLVCSLCKIMHGACVRCSHGTCRTSFHPICARESKLQMEIWGKFGQDNVEMRVFCAKHSTGRDVNSVQSIRSCFEQDSTQVDLLDGKPVTGKEQVRFTRSNKDKFANDKIVVNSCSFNKIQTVEVATSPSTAGSLENREPPTTDVVVDEPLINGSLGSNSGDISGVLRKLVDQGKVSVGDIVSEPGPCSESLEAALEPGTTPFSPGLKLKIIKLLQNTVHMPTVQVKSHEEGSLSPQGALLTNDSQNFTNAKLHSGHEEGISSFDHPFPQDDIGNKCLDDLIHNGSYSCCGCGSGVNHTSSWHVLNIDGYHCYIHPYIEEKLKDLLGDDFRRNEHAIVCHGKHNQLSDRAYVDQVRMTNSSHAMEHSPDDEIEGEMVYLQSNLIKNVVVVKQRYEELMLKVVQNISYELDSFNKRKWDHIIVNQFLRDLREAKKRGNSERRHKEALAILASTVPYVESSSRNAAVRKESENVTSMKQEGMSKATAGSSRVSQLSSLSQTKDVSCSNNKVSDDTNFGIFDLAKFSKKNAFPCDVCMRADTVLNRIFVCSSCKAAVHLDCYRNLQYPTGPWICERCQEMPLDIVTSGNQSDSSGAKACLVQCGLCHGTSGAFRKTLKGHWVHAFCAEWLLETTFRRGQYNAVKGMESLRKGKSTCSICNLCVGACLKCSTADCQITFHPTCAKDVGLYMNTKRIGNVLRHEAYCGQHSIEQRKDYCQQYGPEELKSMKQMRVELELLRFLCERIIKREKVKKDMVICGHDILSARRISDASSVWSYYASGPGASSESATTSVNNKSYSGLMQRSDDAMVRSDDVTVDSTITRKHMVRFPLHNRDADRNAADSSTSTISYKRKLDDGESLMCKNLHESIAVENVEKKSTDKKHKEPYQKEQVVLKNKSHPERYVYTRRSSLSKRKQCNQHIVEGPGG